MKEIINFLIEVQKLKETPKTGWVLMGVKNPETIADHVFRVTLSSWLLGKKKNFPNKRLILFALFHDLAEVYAGDRTPFFYWDKLDRRKKSDREILLKGVRLSKREKEKRSRLKFRMEKKSLLKLISRLDLQLKNEIFFTWLNYEKRISREGIFVKQLDRIETLLQAIEYFGPKEVVGGTSWWEGTEEIVEDPLLLEFLKVVQKKFYGRVLGKYKRDEELEGILDFLLAVGKLKRMPRLYWLLRKVRKPETVAGHIFTLTLMAWILARERKELNLEKLLKMALCHELSAVYTGDTTPYDRILRGSKKEQKKILEKMVRLSYQKKKRIFSADYRQEKKALERLTAKVSPSLKKEIIQLWHEYRTKSNREGHFLSQVNTLAILLEAILYTKKDKKFSLLPLWELSFETVEDPLLLKFLKEMKKI